MFATHLLQALPFDRWCWGLTLVFCLVLAGCCNLNLRGEKFREDELSTMGQQFRSTESSNDGFGFSNKAKQIERNFGF